MRSKAEAESRVAAEAENEARREAGKPAWEWQRGLLSEVGLCKFTDLQHL